MRDALFGFVGHSAESITVIVIGNSISVFVRIGRLVGDLVRMSSFLVVDRLASVICSILSREID